MANRVRYFFGLPLRFNVSLVHHGLYGLVFLALALGLSYVMAVPSWVSWLLYISGMVMFVDDLIQHWMQAYDPAFRSWLHRWYGMTLYKLPLIQKLNVWADKWFTRKDS